MIQVSISNTSGQNFNAFFETQTLATEYINQGIAENWWGAPQRILSALQASQFGLSSSQASLTTNITSVPAYWVNVSQIASMGLTTAQSIATQTISSPNYWLQSSQFTQYGVTQAQSIASQNVIINGVSVTEYEFNVVVQYQFDIVAPYWLPINELSQNGLTPGQSIANQVVSVPAYWLQSSQLTSYGFITSQAIATQNVVIGGQTITEYQFNTITEYQFNFTVQYTFPAEYTITQTDVTNLPINPDWIKVRSQRDALLSACDHLMLSDAVITSSQLTEWQTYRTALRNVPENNSSALAISWPVPPTLPLVPGVNS